MVRHLLFDPPFLWPTCLFHPFPLLFSAQLLKLVASMKSSRC